MKQVCLNVTGMSCTGCEQQIVAALKRLDGVGRVTADHRAATVVVDYEPGVVEEATIVRRLEASGYHTPTIYDLGPERTDEDISP